jgi:hypothetical protein
MSGCWSCRKMDANSAFPLSVLRSVARATRVVEIVCISFNGEEGRPGTSAGGGGREMRGPAVLDAEDEVVMDGGGGGRWRIAVGLSGEVSRTGMGL